MIRVTVWNEFAHEKNDERVREIYPDGIHACLAGFLSKEEDFEVRTATLDDPECGLTEEVLENTDVLIWWGHIKHRDVPDEVAERVQRHVLSGMGAIFLHSAHHSKPFIRLMGTTCDLGWREDGDTERVWILDHNHPILEGIDDRYIELAGEETYAEPFTIPTPDKLLMIGWYSGGEVIRAASLWNRDNGKVFYFQPGHETFPTYYNEKVQKIITNAVRFMNPICKRKQVGCEHIKKIEN